MDRALQAATGGTACPHTPRPTPRLTHLTGSHWPEQVGAAPIRQRHTPSRLSEAREQYRDLGPIAELKADVIAPDPNRQEAFTEIECNTKPEPHYDTQS